MSKSWGAIRREFNDPGVPVPYVRTKFKYVPEEPEVDKVFVIFNEWTDIANNTSSELVDGKFFLTEGEAWDALNMIAESYETELDKDDTSIQLEDHDPSLQNEEYYIQELSR